MNRIHCPQCQHRLKYDTAHAGKRVRCQKCNYRFLLPQHAPPPRRRPPPGPALPTAACPGCGQKISLSLDELPLWHPCAKCGQEFVPLTGETRSPESPAAEPPGDDSSSPTFDREPHPAGGVKWTELIDQVMQPGESLQAA